ncbi:hypothetical protein DO021_21370 [Desulfobacter hydrogenophilus]|uniref:Class I SAM-dependent methyltransferase n=1 Tax=Desulfobacter hydrogenophilus TaxID=2291 RepID=A0A328F9C0_9BACT|nr:class I SAM-dependent methyltransferase [Desulfobacter hydrogenophilus]NDY74430.1 class I SAM-dependent methyltransferase [Desulfobacter hydrogenophilus]QBH13719.1 class I SAM-dependent methyltransferase [Desulfobacter hydrogenophilus]RAM00002.1 hypothetical protein DO021_21370 [Desulfobacter hydrogenophilus]
MVQVKSEHYQKNYITADRFQLYNSIVQACLKYECNEILEIGIGQGIVSHTLKFVGKKMYCADFDLNLNPDVSMDIRQLPFKNDSFDMIIASQVLEHIPFGDFKKSLVELRDCSKKYVIISVPYNQHFLSFRIDLKINKYLRFRGQLNRFLKRIFPANIYLGLPQTHRHFKFDGEHYWEIGYKEFPLIKVKNVINECFKILDDFRVELSPYHYIFILEKK